MIKFYLIRHFKTYGNTKRRYIGTTDEPLCPEGIAEKEKHNYSDVEIIFSSPLKRCLETAALIYPDQKPVVIQNLSECDFGEFENKSAAELSSNPAYQKWVDSGGTLPFPKGESREEFIKRSVDGFLEAAAICREKNISRAALVVHGGTIMSIMSHFLPEKGDYYHWQCSNGDGYEFDFY